MLLPAPWFLPDETIYFAQARDIAWSTGAIGQGIYGGGQPGLPALLAPVVALTGSSRALYFASLSLIAVISACSAIPAYCIARRYMAGAAALTVAALAPLAPGSWLLSSAVLTEPLFGLSLLVAILCTIRAMETGGWGRLLMAMGAACATLLFRPFGLCVVGAFAVSLLAWGIAAGRLRRILSIYACLAVAGAGFILVRWAWTGQIALTDYATEPLVREKVVAVLLSAAGQASILRAALYDAGYLVVAGFFVAAALAAALVADAIRRPRALSPTAAGLLAGGGTLLVLTLLLSGVARAFGVPEPMYGRYVEPLVAPMLIAAFAAARFRPLLCAGFVVAGALLVARMDPGVELTFSNNAGYWYWHLAKQQLGVAAAVVPVAALGAAMLSRRAGDCIVAIAPAMVICTALVSWHLLDYTRSRRGFRDSVTEIAAVVRAHAPAGGSLWVDSRMAYLTPTAQMDMAYFLWAMRFELPEYSVAYYDVGPTQAGDLYLTASRQRRGIIWRREGVSLHRFR